MSKTAEPSLKSLIPALAKTLRLAPAALYERQRALVRANLLRNRPGRGPGSGVEFTPHSLALLLISLLATDSLSETEEATRALAKLKSAKGQCPLTGKKTFAQAVTAVLGSNKLMSSTMFVTARRVPPHGAQSDRRATIAYLDSSYDDAFIDDRNLLGEPFPVSVFGAGAPLAEAKLSVNATLILPWEWRPQLMAGS